MRFVRVRVRIKVKVRVRVRIRVRFRIRDTVRINKPVLFFITNPTLFLEK